MADNTKKSITCDHCEAELIVDSSYPHNYSLELKVIDTGINTSGMQYAVLQHPPLDRTKHFCGKECLKLWITKDA